MSSKLQKDTCILCMFDLGGRFFNNINKIESFNVFFEQIENENRHRIKKMHKKQRKKK